MEKEQYADDVYIYSNSNLTINNINLKDVYYFECPYRNETKRVLNLYQCSGECLSNNANHKCKLAASSTTRFYIHSCPYLIDITSINEPRRESKPYVLWHYIYKYLQYRLSFGKYADYLSNNDNCIVSEQLYNKLKTIPEFSMKHVFRAECDLDDMKKKIQNNIQYKFYLSLPFDTVFFQSLRKHYLDELQYHKDVYSCRILVDKDTADYLAWKDNQNYPLADIGNYYLILYDLHHIGMLPDFLHINTTFTTEQIAFFRKEDIQQVYSFFQNNYTRNYMYHYITECLEKLLNQNEEEE